MQYAGDKFTVKGSPCLVIDFKAVKYILWKCLYFMSNMMTYPSVCLYFYSASVCSHLLIELGGKMWVIIRQESNYECDSLPLLK